jgi:hypothetical protein
VYLRKFVYGNTERTRKTFNGVCYLYTKVYYRPMNAENSVKELVNICFRPDRDGVADFEKKRKVLGVNKTDFAKAIFEHGFQAAYAALYQERLSRLQDAGGDGANHIPAKPPAGNVSYSKSKKTAKTKEARVKKFTPSKGVKGKFGAGTAPEQSGSAGLSKDAGGRGQRRA